MTKQRIGQCSGHLADDGLRLFRLLVLTTLMLALAGCAATPSAAERDELIRQRAQARWDALLAQDYAGAYAFASPGYRATMSEADFEISVRLRRVQYISAEYVDHRCDDNACDVRMKLGYRVVKPVAGMQEWKGSSVVLERWINLGGEWWFVPES